MCMETSISLQASTCPLILNLGCFNCCIACFLKAGSGHLLATQSNKFAISNSAKMIANSSGNHSPSSPIHSHRRQSVPARAQGPQHAITIIVTHSLTPPTLTAHAQEPQGRKARPCVRQRQPNIRKHQCRSACSTRGLSCVELRNHQFLALASIALISSRH